MILHIITNLSETGGAEASLKRFIAACPHYRHAVVSLMGVAEREVQALEMQGVSVTSLGIGSALGLATGPFAFSRQIARMRPRVIICWMYHANFFGCLAARLSGSGAPLFWNVRHSLEDLACESRSTRLAIRANRLLSRWADGIIYCSQRSRIQHEALGFSSRHSAFIPNGYCFGMVTTRRSVASSGNRLVIGAAGRLHAAKDYPTLLATAALVLARNPQVEFVLAGKGVSKNNPEFASMLRTAGVDESRVQAIGQVSDMDEFYSGLDLFMLSSTTEGFPNVLAEAMGHGIPCVTTDVGDAADIVGDCGKVVPPHAPEALAEAILEIAALTEVERSELGKRARESVVARFGISGMVSAYLYFLGLEPLSDQVGRGNILNP